MCIRDRLSTHEPEQRQVPWAWVLSARDLVNCFSPYFYAHIIICSLRLKATSFMYFILVFYLFPPKSVCVTTAIILYMEITLNKEDVFNDFWWVETTKILYLAWSQKWVSCLCYISWTITHHSGQWPSKQTFSCLHSHSII